MGTIAGFIVLLGLVYVILRHWLRTKLIDLEHRIDSLSARIPSKATTAKPDEVNAQIVEARLLATRVDTNYRADRNWIGIVLILVVAGAGIWFQTTTDNIPAQINKVLEEKAVQQSIDRIAEADTSAKAILAMIPRLRAARDSLYVTGSTDVANTEWLQYDSIGVYTTVNTSKGHFKTTPRYFCVLVGNSGNFQTLGGSSIYDPKPDRFRVYIRSLAGPIDVQNAKASRWHIEWIALPVD